MANFGSIASAVTAGPRKFLEQYGDQLLFYAKAIAWTPRAIKRYPREIMEHPRRGDVRFRRTRAGRRLGRSDRVPGVLRRHRGRHPGLRVAEPARRRQVQRVHLRLLQHPRGRAADLLDRARGHGGLRLHRPPRRDADLRGDRRPRGDGHPVAAVPGHDPDDRGVRRGDPALHRGAERVLPLAAADRDLHLRTVARHLRPLLPGVPATHRHPLVVRQAAVPGRSDHPDPLLLRLHGLGRARRCRAWRSAGRSAPASSSRSSPTSSSASRSGAPPPPYGSRGNAGDAGQHPSRQQAGAQPPAGSRRCLPDRDGAAGRAVDRDLQKAFSTTPRSRSSPTGPGSSSPSSATSGSTAC